jgi:hypothetical protein
MISRKLPLLYSHLTPDADHFLRLSLQSSSAYDASSIPAASQLAASIYAKARTPTLEAAHHLVYFNPAIPADELLPDGTDPLQSPGAPFVRRMWAGGSIRIRRPRDKGGKEKREPVLDGGRWVCHEFIRDVQIKGPPGEEKVFVGIERRMARMRSLRMDGWLKHVERVENEVRAKLWDKDEEEFGAASVIERRNIVFMRERGPEEMEAIRKEAESGKKGKMLLRKLWSFCFKEYHSNIGPNILITPLQPNTSPTSSTP